VKTLVNATPRNNIGAVQNRLEQLRTSLQQLDMQMTAKQARRAALREGVNRARKEADLRSRDDQILKELQMLLKLRADAVAKTRQLNDQAMVSREEVSNAEAALAEAKIRVAEREAALASGGKGDLLERMSDELAMVEVDLLELDIQMGGVREQLKRYDLSAKDPKQLDELLLQEPLLGGGNRAALSALKEDLRKQAMQLQRERFALIVDDVALQEPPKQQSANPRPDF
jgi:hypothetical protein